jgi:hypothetical protein
VEIGRQQLDQGFFPSRWERASKAEKSYLQFMAADGDEGSTRSSLIRKGIIYAPALGRVAFTVTGMADYISRFSDA